MKKNIISEITLIAFISILTCYYYFTYETVYLDNFGITNSFITFSLDDVKRIIPIAIKITINFCIIFYLIIDLLEKKILKRKKDENQSPELEKRRKIFLSLIIASTIYTLFNGQIALALYLILVFSAYPINNITEKIINKLKKKISVKSETETIKKDKLIKHNIIILFIYVLVSFYAIRICFVSQAIYDANEFKKETNTLFIHKNKEHVFIRKYNNAIILKNYKKNKNIKDGKTIILNFSELKDPIYYKKIKRDINKKQSKLTNTFINLNYFLNL